MGFSDSRHPPHQCFLTADGRVIPASASSLHLAVNGLYEIPSDITEKAFFAAITCEAIIVDLTHAPQRLLNNVVYMSAWCTSRAMAVCLPSLRECGSLDFRSGAHVELPQLVVARNLTLGSADECVEVPKLQTCRVLEQYARKVVSFPALRSAYDIDMMFVPEVFNFPNLKFIRGSTEKAEAFKLRYDIKR